jgi:hypothetical protein
MYITVCTRYSMSEVRGNKDNDKDNDKGNGDHVVQLVE